MALGFCSYCSLYQNPLPANPDDNKLSGTSPRAPTKSSGFSMSTSHFPTSDPALISTPGPAPSSALTVSRYTDKNL